MSVPFCLAVAITRRGLPLDALDAGAGEEFRELAGCVEVQPDPALERLDARIEIETVGGDRLVSEWRGEAASYAWSWDEIVSWALSLGDEVSPAQMAAIERVIEAVSVVDEAGGVGSLAAATMITPSIIT
jgi:hypothetical protein